MEPVIYPNKGAIGAGIKMQKDYFLLLHHFWIYGLGICYDNEDQTRWLVTSWQDSSIESFGQFRPIKLSKAKINAKPVVNVCSVRFHWSCYDMRINMII
jgi:hypothetical protein